MPIDEPLFLVFTILGGLALFLFGMQLMTEGLRAAAGERLRVVIYRSTGNRLGGLGLGTGLGFLMHSSAASVMTVGFINAGLLSLAHSIPVLMGANIGTTLSMQLISLKLTDYALMAVAIGFLLSMVAPSDVLRSVGRSILGFGLLFNGMALMSGAIEPHREALLPWLSHFDGTTFSGLLLGTLLAWAFTAVVQSSGATIGMTFVLISAGVFTSLEQVYPIVLGAHLGTTTTAIIASLGCGIEARRGAAANFAFNVFNVALGLVAAPLFIAGMELSSPDLLRQTANLHTAIMVVAAFLLLPFTAALAGLARRALPSREPLAEPSQLDPGLIRQPENALSAVIREMRRSLDISARSLAEARAFFADSARRRPPKLIRINELAVNEIRDATRDYLNRLTSRYLSRRQRLLAQSLSHISRDVERIGDYVEHIVQNTVYQRGFVDAAYDHPMQAALLELFGQVQAVLDATRESLDPDKRTFARSRAIEEAGQDFFERAQAIRHAVNERVARHEIPALAGMYFSNHVLWFDGLVRHCAAIAREEQHSFFAIKAAKLDRVEPLATEKSGPPPKKARLPDGAGPADVD